MDESAFPPDVPEPKFPTLKADVVGEVVNWEGKAKVEPFPDSDWDNWKQ